MDEMIQRTPAYWLLQGILYALALTTGLALALSMANLVEHGWAAFFHAHKEAAVRGIINGILDSFVLVELLRSFLDYLVNHRVHRSLLIETALVFVLREMAAGLYQGEDGLAAMLGYALLIPALAVSWRLLNHCEPEERT